MRQLGLAVLQLGQRLRSHWRALAAASLELEGLPAEVPNASSSRGAAYFHRATNEATDGAPSAGHAFAWRDAFDVVVRWRQLSEPNDPVWWIDRLSPEAFKDGFGLQTPLVNGQLKVFTSTHHHLSSRVHPRTHTHQHGTSAIIRPCLRQVIRYFPYFAPAFVLMKELIVEMMHSAGQGSPGADAAVQSLSSLEALYDAWGKVSLGAVREATRTRTVNA